MFDSCNFTYVNVNDFLSNFFFFFSYNLSKKKALNYAQTINIPYHLKLLSQTIGTFQ